MLSSCVLAMTALSLSLIDMEARAALAFAASSTSMMPTAAAAVVEKVDRKTFCCDDPQCDCGCAVTGICDCLEKAKAKRAMAEAALVVSKPPAARLPLGTFSPPPWAQPDAGITEADGSPMRPDYWTRQPYGPQGTTTTTPTPTIIRRAPLLLPSSLSRQRRQQQQPPSPLPRMMMMRAPAPASPGRC